MQLIYNFYPQEGLRIYVFPRYQPFAKELLKRTFTAIFYFLFQFCVEVKEKPIQNVHKKDTTKYGY